MIGTVLLRKACMTIPFNRVKRTGPDLARVGGRYSDEWHRAHLKYPCSLVRESIMPTYAFLPERYLPACA